jgi:hypothetical protein
MIIDALNQLTLSVLETASLGEESEQLADQSPSSPTNNNSGSAAALGVSLPSNNLYTQTLSSAQMFQANK